MITPQDETFLRRALRLAMNGRGHVEPNPMVGCVLVKNDQIISEGWHTKFGGPHAEPNALADCKARGNDPAGATAYVTLEPCCHLNKKTPPCAPRLIEAKIARVVIGCLDPNSDVNGNGVTMLRAAGVEVDALPRSAGFQPASSGVEDRTQVGNLRHEELNASHFQQLIAPFISRLHSGSRYITFKWAQTADGKVAGADRRRMQISNSGSSRRLHGLRTCCDAIVVGINTVLMDDPLLTVRGVERIRTPLRVVLDTHLRIPLGCQLVQTAKQTPTAVIAHVSASQGEAVADKLSALRAARVVVETPIAGDDATLDLYEVFNLGPLSDWAFTHVLVEPGPTLARASSMWADRIWVFRSSTVFAGPDGLAAPAVPEGFVPTGTLNLAGDTLTEYLNTRSPAFFAAVPSADFVLAAEDAGSPVA